MTSCPSIDTQDVIPSESGVLLVDDEPHIINALKRALRGIPWKVHTAPSGERGLEVLEQEQILVVISDYRMGGMDGIAFLSRVKQTWPDVQRVMLTGQTDIDSIERAVNESEVFRFLSKPWTDSHLMAVVNECFDRFGLIECNRRYENELAQRNRELAALNEELEEKVRERTRALIQSEKMAALGRMAGGVAHEINNPLGGILAFAQVLLRDDSGSDPQASSSLETIQSCALRCKTIVDNLLSFSRMPSGDEYSNLSINQLAEEALTIARLHPMAKLVDVRCELAPDLPFVRGRPGLLEQVVVNLLQNAYQASKPDQEVVMRTRLEGKDVVVEVEDQGAGIPADVLPKIFEPFFTTKATGEGTGLGLFICYGIAQEHSGNIEVVSEEGRGAKFILRLPATSKISGKE
jgi:signal transduction histidine kinase